MTQEEDTRPIRPKDITNNIPRRTNVSVLNDKRLSLIRLVKEQGQSIKSALEILRIKYSCAKSISNKHTKLGIVSVKPKGGSSRFVLTSSILERIDSIVTYNPQYTLKEIKLVLETENKNEHNISISQ